MTAGAPEIYLTAAGPLRFDLSLAYLRRRAGELVDRVEGDHYRRLLHLPDGHALIEVRNVDTGVGVRLLDADGRVDPALLDAHVRRVFSLDVPIRDFYRLAREDARLAGVVERFHGFRPVLAASPFEALIWAIVGQQITLSFAFVLKERLVREYGESRRWGGEMYWAFPTPEALAGASPDRLRSLQFSRRKAEYIIGVAQAAAAGSLDLAELAALPAEEAVTHLTGLRGIGRWTAEYLLMRGYGARDALPAADIGLRNAVTQVYGLDHQATEAEVRALAGPWSGWRSYAAFYLWATLWPPAEVANAVEP